MKKKTWYKLDNAAKIYPPVSSGRRASVFGLSAVLDEQIDKDILNDAVNVVLNRFPAFKVKLKRGIFWYYLEENKKPFYVAEEPPFFLQYINEKESNDYLFRVFYLNNKITLAIFHALGDGTGGMEVLKAIVFEYLLLSGHKIKANNELKTIYSPALDEESSDKFLQVYTKKLPKPEKEFTAFKVSGTPFSIYGTGIITGKVKVEQIKVLAKNYGVTITSFLVGLLMHLTYKNFVENKKVKNKNIRFLVPVNMRKFYPSETVRNFALFTRPGHDYKDVITLEEAIATCSEQIKKGTQKEVLDCLIASHVKKEKNWALKMAPLFVKDLAMQLAYCKVGDNLHTTTLSNLGTITLPQSVQKHVKEFIFTLGTGYSAKNAVAVCSYNDYLNITFSREFAETSLEKDFFRYLTQNGVEVELSSNYWEDNQ